MMQEEAEAKAEVAAPLADSAEEGVKEDAPVEGAGNANAAAAKAAGEGEEGDDEDEGEYDDEDYGDEDADYDDYDEDEDEEDEAGEGAKAKRQESAYGLRCGCAGDRPVADGEKGESDSTSQLLLCPLLSLLLLLLSLSLAYSLRSTKHRSAVERVLSFRDAEKEGNRALESCHVRQ